MDNDFHTNEIEYLTQSSLTIDCYKRARRPTATIQIVMLWIKKCREILQI